MPIEFPKNADEVLYILDLVGTQVYAISGSIAASSKKLDLFGAAFIAFVTAVGGGTVRDMLLGTTPFGWMQDTTYIYVTLSGVGITFLFKTIGRKLRKTLFLFDMIGIGVFTILGLNKALILGVSTPIAVMMGIFSAVLGGGVRDILINEIPLIFIKEIYAMACVAGGTAFVFLKEILSFEWNVVATISLIIAIRIVVIKFKIGLSEIDDSKRRIFTKSE